MEPRHHALVFYDGHCGLCHRAVLFALRKDRDGSRFRFAPLQGTTFNRELSWRDLPPLTDSILLMGKNGVVQQQTEALITMLEMLGGAWLILGRLIARVPRSWRDAAYRGLARMRHRLFRRPEDLCPVVTPPWSDRFLP